MPENIDHGIGIQSERIVVTSHVRQNLLIAAKWGRIAALALFILSTFFLVCMLLSVKRGATTGFNREQFLLLALVLLIVAILAFLPGLHLHKLCVNLQRSIKNDDQIDFEVGVDYLKSLLRLLGVYGIVLMTLIALLIGYIVYMNYFFFINW
jgi:hypothetical protein